MSSNGNGSALVREADTVAPVRAASGGSFGLAPATFDQARQLAGMLAQAHGFVPRSFAGKPHEILAAILTGAEIGLRPMEALRSIHVVEGRPMLSAELMLSLAMRAGVRVQWLESSETAVRARFTRAGYGEHVESFSIEDAKRAGLAGRGNWAKYPRAMLRARCVSSALRAWAPDALGAPGFYVEGEIEAEERPAPFDAIAQAREEEPRGADVVEGEASCAAPPPPKPAAVKLTDCTTEEALLAWISRYGTRAVAQGKAEAVVAQAATVGVSRAQALRWLGVEEAPATHDPEAGEVPPDEEPEAWPEGRE